ncbi:MAG TPA: hypothetical protein PLB32_12760 [Acidobacteriota bacterium]|nr:hypothetical protein [Acidobacteriota bacterium]
MTEIVLSQLSSVSENTRTHRSIAHNAPQRLNVRYDDHQRMVGEESVCGTLWYGGFSKVHSRMSQNEISTQVLFLTSPTQSYFQTPALIPLVQTSYNTHTKNRIRYFIFYKM